VVALLLYQLGGRASEDALAVLARPAPDGGQPGCILAKQTQWRQRSLRDGAWRVSASVDRKVPDSTALELLLAIRDGKLLDPTGQLGPNANGVVSCRRVLLRPRQDLSTATVSTCVPAESANGTEPSRFQVQVFDPPGSNEGCELHVEVGSGVRVLGAYVFMQ